MVSDDPATVGALRLCKDYLAWSEVDPVLLSLLLEKRGMVSESRPLDEATLKKMGFKKHQELAAKMLKEGMRLSAVEGVRPFFKLAPPRGGFKRSLRRQYSQKGTTGKNPDLPKIVERMV